ncbi:MAG: VWA domain-containing protein [Acidobacteria bacterium]|nr:VWA domain-containing protein [Acidobacteriota bacterium]
MGRIKILLALIALCSLALIAPPHFTAHSQQTIPQNILDKQTDVQTRLREIVRLANENQGKTFPATSIELEINRLETDLTSMDFRLQSLPVCTKAPTAPSTDDARTALKALIPSQTGQPGTKTVAQLEAEIQQKKDRIVVLEKVKNRADAVFKMRAIAAETNLLISMIPTGGKGIQDLLNALDIALDKWDKNIISTPQGMVIANLPGTKDYFRYWRENKAEFEKFAHEQCRKNGIPLNRVTRDDIYSWIPPFNQQKSASDLAQTKTQLQKLEDELKKKKATGPNPAETYFTGLLEKFEKVVAVSKWMADPTQFEKMKSKIIVVIVDDKTNASLNNATLTVAPAAGTQQSAANPFEFADVNKGTYSFKATAPDYVPESTQVDVTDCKTYSAVLRMKKLPIINIASIKDENGNLLDNIQVDAKNLSGGAGASATYQKNPIDLKVDPAAYEVTGKDPTDKYEPASQSVNADAGQTAVVNLVMRPKGGTIFAVEFYDSTSKLKIDAPPDANQPSVQLDPIEGQPAPAKQPYTGTGDVTFKGVQAGRYNYFTSICGWENVSGTFTISADELKNARITRQVTLKPRSLDSFTGSVIEEGTNDHIDKFKVALIGLGPRQGYRYDTVEGKDPNPNARILFGAFVIQGPIYSGRYRLEITRDCFEPYVKEIWWGFCLDRGAYTPQIFRMEPTPEFRQARQKARDLIEAINKQREKAKKAADQVQEARRQAQGLSDLARDLLKELRALKQRYPSLAQDCTKAEQTINELQQKAQAIKAAESQIITLRETAKNLAGVACELADKAKKATDATSANNFAQNAKQFAAQARKTADQAAQLGQKAQQDYAALEQKANEIKQTLDTLEKFRKEFAPLQKQLAELRQTMQGGTTAAQALTDAAAAVTEANRLLAAVRQALGKCADNHPGKAIVEQAETASKGVAGERQRALDEQKTMQELLSQSQTSANEAYTLGSEIEQIATACQNVKDVPDIAASKASADAIEAFAQVAAQSAKTAEDCAKDATGNIAAGQQLVTQIQSNMAKCEYEAALTLATQLQQTDPSNQWLTTGLAQLQTLASAQQQARQYLTVGKAAIEQKNLDGAIGALASALAVPNLPVCMRTPMESLKKELEKRKEFIGLTEQVEEATKQCDYTKAQQVVGKITAISPRYDFITTWMNTELPKLSELILHRQQALQFIKDADSLANQAIAAAATEPVDWAKVGQLVQQTMSKLDEADRIAPKCMQERSQMDAIRQKCRDIQQKKPAEIQTSIVLLIDTSGSMGDNNKIENAKAAARAAVRNVSKTNEMAVLNFSGDCSGGAVRYACPFTTDLNALLKAIDGLSPGGGTPMYIATGVAVDYAKKKGRGKSATVVLMSDGGDTCRDKQAEAAAAIRQSNIPVNTIGYDVGNNQQAQGDLANLATLTGGRNYSASAADPKEIVNAFKIAMLPSLFKDFELAQGGSGAAVSGHFAAAKRAIQQQDLNAATYQLQQAQSLAPNSAAVNYNLALVNEANDKPLAAIRNAESYLKLAPNALDRADVEGRIAQMRKDVEANPRAEYDPNACRDVYNWAVTERDAAKKSGNPARLQTLLEIQIAAQRGDCTKARQMQAQYRQQFR